jgi:hypothetical protein
MEIQTESKYEWSTPELEELTLNCEVAAYASGDYDNESPELA